MTPGYESGYHARVAERMAALLHAASDAMSTGEPGVDPLALSSEAIELATDMDAEQFTALAPQSMVSVVEAEGFEDRVVVQLACALDLRADILEGQASLIQAQVRREQSAALRSALDRSRAN